MNAKNFQYMYVCPLQLIGKIQGKHLQRCSSNVLQFFGVVKGQTLLIFRSDGWILLKNAAKRTTWKSGILYKTWQYWMPVYYYETTVQLKIMTILFYFYPVKEKKVSFKWRVGRMSKVKSWSDQKITFHHIFIKSSRRIWAKITDFLRING